MSINETSSPLPGSSASANRERLSPTERCTELSVIPILPSPQFRNSPSHRSHSSGMDNSIGVKMWRNTVLLRVRRRGEQEKTPFSPCTGHERLSNGVTPSCLHG